MGLLGRRAAPEPLVELWRAPLRGAVAHTVRCDAATASVWVGDGGNVAFASLRLHRLELATGAATADVRTRHQPARTTALAAGSLWVATDRRLLRLAPVTLEVQGTWDERLVRYTDRLLPLDDGRFVMANAVAPAIGVLDPATGRTRRVTVGPNPVLAAVPGGVAVARSTGDGGWRRLDAGTLRLVDERPGPRVVATAWLAGLWAVPAGSGDGREGTAHVVRLDGDEEQRLAGRAHALVPDPARGVLWAVLQDGLQTVDLRAGTVGPVHGLPSGSRVKHVAPDAGVVAVTLSGRPDDELVLYRVPVA